ncbi:MAG: amidophosphoribosyltransferase [Pseudomonadota bacterium]
MCGIVGIVGPNSVNQELYDALTVLQHRGQDAAGIVTLDAHQRLHLRKDRGMVRDVFQQRHMIKLPGNMGIGHVRYPTAGSDSSAEAQPFYVNSPYGLTLAHNGNLTNSQALAQDLFREDLRHMNTNSDSEVLLNVLAHELSAQHQHSLAPEDIFAAVASVHRRCKGAYAAVCMITGHGLLAFRDVHGIRPLCYGKRETDAGTDYMVASESVALSFAGYTLVRELAPGESVYITINREIFTSNFETTEPYTPCIFEHVYLARPDSVIDQISVYKARLRMGEYLAAQFKKQWSQLDIDVVIPIPDTSRTAALQMANSLGIKYREGFIKNRYIGRTFIMPGQQQRKKSVRQKLNAIDLEFKGKNVVLVDDSIVRGTTCQQIIQMAREAGARNVYFASAAPPVRFPNVYGIDMPSASELIAFTRDAEQIRHDIGADALLYQELDDLIAAVKEGNPKIKQFECSVFDGSYITGDIDENYLKSLDKRRNDSARQDEAEYQLQKPMHREVLDLHNSE